MAGMLAVILLLNGVQIDLPGPALLVHGTAWVPLRAVCERQGAQVAPTPDGAGVVVHARGTVTYFSLVAEPLPSPPPTIAVTLEGVAYVPARALAEALGGRCDWDAEARAVTLEVPWVGPVASVGSPAALRGDVLAWRGRVVSGGWRHGGGLIDWLPQGFSTGAAAQPLSGRGRALRVTGRVGLDGRGGAVIEPVDLEVEAWGPCVSVMISPRELSPGGKGLVVVKMANHTDGRMDLTGWPALRVRLEGPVGQTAGVTLGEVPTGLEAGEEGCWTGSWQVPAGEGREHVGVWRARLRTPPGIEGAECRFTVRVPAGAAGEEAR